MESADTLTDAIALLQRSGWTCGDVTKPESEVDSAGVTRNLLRCTHSADGGQLGLLYGTDPDTGEVQVFVRPADATGDSALGATLATEDPENGDVKGTDGLIPEDPSPPVAITDVSRCGFLYGGEALFPGQSLRSCANGYRLTMQTDGNLVAYTSRNAVVWASGTNHRTPRYVIMQNDGNLVIYFTSGRPWATGTNGNTYSYFRMQDDGNLVVYSRTARPLWRTDTWCLRGCPTGQACHTWGCVYNERGGYNTACFLRYLNNTGEYYYHTVRTGHGPNNCSGVFPDYWGHGHTCPVPAIVGKLLVCGRPAFP
jgi:hypothetical protein